MEFYTIGVYNSKEDDFFRKLTENNIDVFCDIRQRRGVRGSEYSFVNSVRLQQKLAANGVSYIYVRDLAPTSEIRNLQKEADAKLGEQKRSRNQIGKAFSIAYKNQILNNFDFDSLIRMLKNKGAKRIVFFCVEEKPEACHRSIVAEKLMQYGYKITNL